MKKIKEVLPTSEDKKGKIWSSIKKKVIKVLAIIVIVILVFISLHIIAFFGLYNWLESYICTLTGFDTYLARAITLILLALILGTSFGSTIWSFLPIPQKNKRQKRLIFLSVLAIFFFAAYFTSKNVYFNPNDGTPTQYYCVGSDGEYHFFKSDGYDPETGAKLLPVTKELILKIKKDKEAFAEPSPRIVNSPITFEPVAPEQAVKVKEEIVIQQEEKVIKKPENKFKETVKKEIVKTGYGYAISLDVNNYQANLANVFKPMDKYSYTGRLNTCETIFNNNSSGTFIVYDSGKQKLFKVPPGRELAIKMTPDCYYFKPVESENFTPLNIPNRTWFCIDITNSDVSEPGEFFFLAVRGEN